MTTQSKEVLEAVIRSIEKASILGVNNGIAVWGGVNPEKFIQALREEIDKCILCGEQKHICQHEKGFDEEIKSMFGK